MTIEFKNYSEEYADMEVHEGKNGYVCHMLFDSERCKWVLQVNGGMFSSQALRKIADKLDEMGYEP